MPYLKSLGLPEMRIYFGTDARLFSILLGMSLGFLHVCDKRADLKILKNRFVSELLFIAALGELLIMFYTVGETSAFYDYGFIIATLLSLILIVLCSNEEYSLFNTLRLPALKYLAASSYEVYLVHYPLRYYALMLPDFNQNIRFYYYCAVFVSAAILHFALGIRFKKNWKVWLGNGLKIAVLVPIL
ncbi:MAG: acyltransferase family protein, partial [Erysipelotrichaceae bacterium]|nr:acyltransferase family protein [Erysipelotrichaceae bacterium]